jgi:branched-chain amino acid transport system ATP-binding protein
MALLQVQRVSKSFAGLRAVAAASFEVAEGSIVALIGPNGAGKTTLFNLIAGVYRPDEGEILFAGGRIHGLRPHQICAAGIGRTFQIVKPFAGLSVLDNVVIGALHREPSVPAARRASEGILAQLSLHERRDRPASTLTLPDRKRLELARALATRPRLLLLDEVMAGLRPTECDELLQVLVDIQRRQAVTILLIEHVMRAVMALAEQVVVLHHGEVIARGSPEQVVRDPDVVACYLGQSAAG